MNFQKIETGIVKATAAIGLAKGAWDLGRGVYDWYRNRPQKVGDQLTLTFGMYDEVWEWVAAWVKDELPNIDTTNVRSYTAVTLNYGPSDKHFILVPSEEINLDYKAVRISFNFGIKEEAKDKEKKTQASLTFKTNDEKILSDFITFVRKKFYEKEFVPKLFEVRGGFWQNGRDLVERNLVLPEKDYRAICGDVENFIAQSEKYEKLGISHQRGYGFFGLPGTGKTTLIYHLAYKYRYNLFTLSLKGMTDGTLSEICNNVGSRSIIVFEDIDVAGVTTHREKKACGGSENEIGGLSLKGLLNAINGLNMYKERIFIMTANRPENLDDALVRSGRIDFKLNFKEADEYQIRRLFAEIEYPISDEEVKDFLDRKLVMSDLQNELLKKL